MLAVTRYEPAYVDAARKRVADLLAAHAALSPAPGPAFDRPIFRQLLLALDNTFAHRLRAAEGKDGNPLNELRVLCGSILHNDARLAADKQIKLDPARSVLGLKPGDPIDLDAAAFERLAEGVFTEIEKRFA